MHINRKAGCRGRVSSCSQGWRTSTTASVYAPRGRAHVSQVSIHSRWDADDMTSCYHDNGWLGKAVRHEPTCWLIMKSPLLPSPLPLLLEQKKDRRKYHSVQVFWILHQRTWFSWSLCWVVQAYAVCKEEDLQNYAQVFGYPQSICNQFTRGDCSCTDCFSKLFHLKYGSHPAS